MIFIFSYRMIRTGGTENLLVKLASQIRSNGNEVRCVCEYCSEEISEILKANCVELDVLTWDEIGGYIDKFDCDKELLITVFEWNTFLTFFYLKRNNKKTVLYAVHPECIRGEWEEQQSERYQKDLRVYKKSDVNEYISKLIESNHLLVMDEVVKEETERFLGEKFNLEILRISVDIRDKWDDIARQIKYRYHAKKVIAASRAEFPFKAYLFGLLGWFAENNTELKDIEIVCYGDGFDEIKRYITGLSEGIRSKITLTGKISYEELRDKINESFVFVGMGTSVIDAAEMGVVSIPVKPFEYDVRVNGRFDEEPHGVCASDLYKYRDFTKVMKEIFNWEYECYNKISKKSYELVRDRYSTELIAKRLINYFKLTSIDNISDDTGFFEIDNNAFIDFKKKWSGIVKVSNGRKIAIYGAGIGGRDILLKNKEYGMKVDCFIDKNMSSNIYGVPVYQPSVINKEEYYVVISLKKYYEDIVEWVEGLGLQKGTDYCYMYCELEAGV